MAKIEITRPSQDELDKLNVKTWSSWGCEESTFDWQYDDEEVCYILEGEVVVETAGGEKVTIKKGDLVTFPKGLKCVWHVKEAIRKVYSFR